MCLPRSKLITNQSCDARQYTTEKKQRNKALCKAVTGLPNCRPSVQMGRTPKKNILGQKMKICWTNQVKGYPNRKADHAMVYKMIK